jgi:diacylglycerol O-acyltransferase / wax synthase
VICITIMMLILDTPGIGRVTVVLRVELEEKLALAEPGRGAVIISELPTVLGGAQVRRQAPTGRNCRRKRSDRCIARQALSPAAAPRTSLNQRVQTGRRIWFVRLSLATAKHAAHAHHGKVNDVVLAIWTGGLRQLLVSRAEPVERLEPIPTLPTSSRSAGGTGSIDNEFGAMALPLPVWEADAERRLDPIAARTREAKARQHPAAVIGLLARLSATPLGRYLAGHQHAVNVEVTNVTGPHVPAYLFGAPVLAILPIVGPVGNMGAVLCALSYAGQLFLVVTADAHGFPDLDVLMAGMEADGRALLGSHGGEPASAPCQSPDRGELRRRSAPSA